MRSLSHSISKGRWGQILLHHMKLMKRISMWIHEQNWYSARKGKEVTDLRWTTNWIHNRAAITKSQRCLCFSTCLAGKKKIFTEKEWRQYGDTGELERKRLVAMSLPDSNDLLIFLTYALRKVPPLLMFNSVPVEFPSSITERVKIN